MDHITGLDEVGIVRKALLVIFVLLMTSPCWSQGFVRSSNPQLTTLYFDEANRYLLYLHRLTIFYIDEANRYHRQAIACRFQQAQDYAMRREIQLATRHHNWRQRRLEEIARLKEEYDLREAYFRAGLVLNR